MGSFGAILQNRVKWGHLGRFFKIALNGAVLPDFQKSRQMGSFYPILKNRVKWGRFTRFRKIASNGVVSPDFQKCPWIRFFTAGSQRPCITELFYEVFQIWSKFCSSSNFEKNFQKIVFSISVPLISIFNLQLVRGVSQDFIMVDFFDFFNFGCLARKFEIAWNGVVLRDFEKSREMGSFDAIFFSQNFLNFRY